MVSMDILEAAEEGNVSALERFGRQAVNESVTDEFGSNCLHYAARHGCLEMLNYLVNQLGFNGNKRSDIGATAAHDAAAAGQLDSLKWLLANTSCDFNDQDGCGSTVLHLACRFGHTPITNWLLETGQCNTEIRASSGGIPLHFAVVGGDRESIELLLDFDPSSVNYQLTNGATPTYLAAQEGQTDILIYLVQKRRGNIKMKAYDGMSCVHAAAQSGNLNCVRFLVEEEKYNPNERDFDGASPLHYAASQGHWEVIDWLMKVGGARVTLDNLGGSPLHNAAESNHLKCIRVLLNNGCSPDITDNNGLNAAELAVKCFHSSAATYIKNYSPQSQHFDDPDLDYLLAVQSPRPPPLKIVQQAPIDPPKAELNSDYLELFPTTTNGVGFHKDKPVNTVTKRSRSPVPQQSAHGFYTKGDRGSKDETDSILARADSSELLVGIPRSGSRDFSEICGSASSRASGSSSSSSLSPQEYKYPESPVANGRKLLHHLPINSLKQRSSSVTIKNPEPQLKSPRSTSLYKRETKVEGKPAGNIFSKLSSTRESRNVTFRSDVSEIRSRSIMESEEDERWRLEAYLSAVSGNDVTKDEKVKEDTENNNRLSFSENLERKGPLVYGDEREAEVPLQDNGSVNKNKYVMNGHMEKGTAPSVDKHPYIAPPADPYNDKMAHGSENENQIGKDSFETVDALNNLKNNPPGSPQISQAKTPLVPKPVYLAAQNNQDGSQNLSPYPLPSTGTWSRSSSDIPEAPPSQQQNTTMGNYSSLDKDVEGLMKGEGGDAVAVAVSIETAEQFAAKNDGNFKGFQPPPPPPPVPPPPPMPPIAYPFAPKLNGEGKTSVNGESMADIRKKTTSLPARPVLNFTAEMMQNRRNSLVPAPVQTPVNKQGNTDFLEELKRATKAAPLRRSSVDMDASRPSVTPTMVFTAGHRKSVSTKPVESKDMKLELKGEWDPKNFVDKVPNRDSLPAWKVQLQARHIAEKEMKEAMEKQQIEERESRFKNMPPWKRALVEKKEAEAREAEEKIKAQKEQAPKVVRKTPKVSVMPTHVEKDGPQLAPWQLELQKKS